MARTSNKQTVLLAGEKVAVLCASGRDVLVSCKDGEIWVPVTQLWWEGETLSVPCAEEVL